MTSVWRNVFGLFVIGMGFGMSAPAQAATGVGPYYAMPSWDQTLPASNRFIVLTNMASQAVLDRETGLVWEQSPEGAAPILRQWQTAKDFCITKAVGTRKGWRLPTIQELASLIDPTVPAPGPTLPPGHPFAVTLVSPFFWSATTYGGGADLALRVNFLNGGIEARIKGTEEGSVWCVRGGQGVDPH